MRVFAYCAASLANATRAGAGVSPVTCPPAAWWSFRGRLLEGRDLVWLGLHGRAETAALFGDEGREALLAGQLAAVDLGGAVVFTTACSLGDEGHPMTLSLLEAGARCVVAGAGANYQGARQQVGAGLLGQWLRRGLEVGLGARQALALARGRVLLAAVAGRNRSAAVDALTFRMMEG